MTDPVLSAAALESRAWPFEEARKLVARIKKSKTAKTEILFETGYGPSGLPHIGTFGEVARTTMVRRAFETHVGYSNPASVLLRRHGRHAQDSRQCAGPQLPGAASPQAADLGAQSLWRRLSRASAITTTPCCAVSSIPSASTMNSPAPRTTTSRASSMPCCCRAARAL